MEFHEDFRVYVIVFIITFAVLLSVLMWLAFYVDIWWSLTFTKLGNQYNSDVPTRVAWEIFFDSIWINLLICVPIAITVGVIIALLCAE